MNVHRAPRGTTLVEAMIAMAVLIIGAVGMVNLHNQGVRTEAQSRRLTRATAIAQDLAAQIELWPFDDPRLANAVPENDALVGDPTFLTECADPATEKACSEDPVGAKLVDHGEADLTLGGTAWNGLPTAAITDYQRFWSVAYLDDSNGNGTPDAARVAVVVRWRSGLANSTWRRVVLLSLRTNPAEAR